MEEEKRERERDAFICFCVCKFDVCVSVCGGLKHRKYIQYMPGVDPKCV